MTGLSSDQLAFFHAEGYVHVPDALTPADLDPVQEELEAIVDQAAQRLLAAGKIDRDYAELPFAKRLIPLAKADASAAAGLNFPANLGPNIFAFLHNPRLLNLLESLIGPEIYANPCQHIRAKVPASHEYAGNFSQSEWARSTAWHQDLGVLLPEADDTLIVTTWIPLVDADEENGTLMIYPRCHTEPLRRHVRPPADQGGSFTVAPEELPPWDPITIPVPARRPDRHSLPHPARQPAQPLGRDPLEHGPALERRPQAQWPGPTCRAFSSAAKRVPNS